MSAQKLSSADRVHQAIVDLMAANRPATRKSIATECRLTLPIVDWHLKVFKEQGRLHSPANGVFELLEQSEDRAISMTLLPHGRCKLEIGDMCTEMSMREGRMLAMAAGGIALVFGR